MTRRQFVREGGERASLPPRHLADLTAEEAADAVVALGLPRYRASQLAAHYYAHLEVDPGTMSDLPSAVGADLAASLFPELVTPVRDLRADTGRTIKTVWRLHDGVLIESVLMAYPDRVTLCLSSQAGCGMGCAFCATGQMGLARNLSAAEIVEQARLAARACRDGEFGEPQRLSNVVFMGMGEPLANYARVLHAVRALTTAPPRGFGLSARHVTVSTVGLVPGIDRLSGEGMPLTLAVSLHAPDDRLRDELCPINLRWTVDEVLDAARRYFEATGRRVSIEYALMRGVNDQAWRADLLAEKLASRGRGWVHVNPIPLNPTPGSPWTASAPEDERTFVERLEARAIPTTIRDTRGREIDGACGQLAMKEAE